MRNNDLRTLAVLSAILIFFPALASCHSPSPGEGHLNKDACYALIRRILPDYASRFKVAYLPKDSGRDVFELETVDNKIVLRGNNGVSVASALNYWLNHYAHCQITWNGTNLHIPAPFPLVPVKVHQTSPYQYRYYLNYDTYNYSIPWWDWKRWQWEIDFMAMNGINMPLALTGQNIIWYKVYRGMGFTDKDLSAFFSGPPYLGEFWMGNFDGWGGPLPKTWMISHEKLEKEILARERALGMTPILPAFTGHVPPAFKDRFPGVKVNTLQWGANFDPTLVLDPWNAMFSAIGEKFLKEFIKTYGTDHLYSADVFNEMIPPNNDSAYLAETSGKIYKSMATADPEAKWIIQGWMFLDKPGFWKPAQMRAYFNGVPDSKIIVLDLDAEARPVWSRTDAFYGENWIWCMLHSFGGRNGLFGDMKRIAHVPAETGNNPASGNMIGIGLSMEGIEQNPAIYSLMLENVWRDKPVNLDQWLQSYVRNRYGKKNVHAEKAWEILNSTVYSHQPWQGAASIITARPTFDKETSWAVTDIAYDPLQLTEAWKQLLEAGGDLNNSDGFQYDLVDVTRQVLANYANVLQQSFASDYRHGDIAAFAKHSSQFLEVIDDLDRILGTRKGFLLGKWLDDAKRWGTTAKEKQLYERDARDVITLWGNKDCNIYDYTNKEWSGLLEGFYKPRWEQFITYIMQCMKTHTKVDQGAFDRKIKDWEWNWVNSHENYPAEPQGDPIKISQQLYQKYIRRIRSAYSQQ